ncbi:hypothetical protein VH571_11960 [Frondihabitans sp. 4ASC-45]|uniref:hypothetical protein n=1 Tax=Frondihabitans sp. 4ASC-45 TaxID=3111636 RepID=UPI003C214C83
MPNFRTILPFAPPAALTVGAVVSPGLQIAAYICVGVYLVFCGIILAFLLMMAVVGTPAHVKNAKWVLNLLFIRRARAVAAPSPATTPPATAPPAT